MSEQELTDTSLLGDIKESVVDPLKRVFGTEDAADMDHRLIGAAWIVLLLTASALKLIPQGDVVVLGGIDLATLVVGAGVAATTAIGVEGVRVLIVRSGRRFGLSWGRNNAMIGTGHVVYMVAIPVITELGVFFPVTVLIAFAKVVVLSVYLALENDSQGWAAGILLYGLISEAGLTLSVMQVLGATQRLAVLIITVGAVLLILLSIAITVVKD